jgi:hypothetical protein
MRKHCIPRAFELIGVFESLALSARVREKARERDATSCYAFSFAAS